MKIVEPSYHLLYAPEDKCPHCGGELDGAYKRIERIGRVAYKSEDKITPESAEKFVRMLADRKHWPVFDHVHVTVLWVTNRGVSHELVRHRIAAYLQESTRFCNYSKGKFDSECSFVRPEEFRPGSEEYRLWCEDMAYTEKAYLRWLARGYKPDRARGVLPNDLKTEIVSTFDFTEWRHVFSLRTAPVAHPQMRQLTVPLLGEFAQRWPAVFADLLPQS
jgi:thymidylate synthase (FAD)